MFTCFCITQLKKLIVEVLKCDVKKCVRFGMYVRDGATVTSGHNVNSVENGGNGVSK